MGAGPAAQRMPAAADAQDIIIRAMASSMSRVAVNESAGTAKAPSEPDHALEGLGGMVVGSTDRAQTVAFLRESSASGPQAERSRTIDDQRVEIARQMCRGRTPAATTHHPSVGVSAIVK